MLDGVLQPPDYDSGRKARRVVTIQSGKLLIAGSAVEPLGSALRDGKSHEPPTGD